MKAKINSHLLKSIKATSKPYEINDVEIPGFILKVRKNSPWTYFYSYYRPNIRPHRRTRYLIGSQKDLSPGAARAVARRLMSKVSKGEDPRPDTKFGCDRCRDIMTILLRA